jgi:colanic acid biosynthesis glycosyl transferase WcaI
MFTYMYWPMVVGKGTRYPKILSEMLQDKYNLTVITRHVDDPNKKRFTREKDEKTEVVRIPHFSFKARGYLARAMTYFSFSLGCLLAIRYVAKGSILFGVHPEPPFFALTIPLVRIIRSSKYLSLVTDLLPDNAFEINIIKNGFLKRIITWYCLTSYRQPDHIIVITEAIRSRLIEYGISSKRISLVELAVDTDTFRPISVDLDKIGLSEIAGKFIVLYSGSFGYRYDFDIILDSAKELEKVTSRIHFIIRGDGDQKEYIKKRISELELENTSLLDPVSDTDTVVSFINTASVCVIPIRDSKSIDMTHPSKLLEFWSCGKPVICTTSGETAKLIREFGAGIAIDPMDKEALVRAILFLLDSPKTLRDMGRNGRTNVINSFSFDKIREKLSDKIDRL